jgi:hypothetical protein
MFALAARVAEQIAPEELGRLSIRGFPSIQHRNRAVCRRVGTDRYRICTRETFMPRGDKSKYTVKQERKAGHIANYYEDRGITEKEAERRAWATVNKDDGGGKAPGGSGRGHPTSHPAAHRGGKVGGAASAHRSAAARSASAKKAAATRKHNSERRADAR